MEGKKRTEIAEIGKFGLIERICSRIEPQNASTVKGCGDDTAVIDAGDRYVLLSTELLLEGVHFDLTYYPLQHLGYKAVVAGISDILAMNGTPRQIELALGIPARFSVEMIDRLYDGIRAACDRYRTDLAGGDTTASVNGLAIGVTAAGDVAKDRIAYRSGAKPNDLICLSGALGAAYMGLHLLEREKRACGGQPDPKPKFEGREALTLMLKVLDFLGDKFKFDYLINVLVGRNNALIKSYGHNKCEWFGSGAEHNDRYWAAVIRQALILGFVDKNIENYGLLSVTDAGRKYLERPYSILLTADHEYEDGDDEPVAPPMGKGSVADEELFAMLKDQRRKVAQQMELPPFVIFQDPSLEDMAIQYPVTMEELQNITGGGAGKARKFGKPFIDLIKRYVEEKEIIRPQDMVV